MILHEEMDININNRNITYYKHKGYDCKSGETLKLKAKDQYLVILQIAKKNTKGNQMQKIESCNAKHVVNILQAKKVKNIVPMSAEEKHKKKLKNVLIVERKLYQ